MTIRQFVETACVLIAQKLKTRLITRGDDSPYLLRNYIWRHSARFKKLPGLYLHCFLASDDEGELHNHPFAWSLSLILSGGYFEDRMVSWVKPFKRWDPHDPFRFNPLADDEDGCGGGVVRMPGVTTRRREVKPFRLNFIRANDFHRVDLRDGRCWTLFLAGPRTQDWGFVDPKTGEFLQWEAHIKRRGEKTQSDRFGKRGAA